MRNVSVNSIGEYIREQREQAKISMRQLAQSAGVLEDRPADSGVRSALLADPQLSERQKQVLIEIYESFRRENAATAAGADDTADAPAVRAELIAGAPGAEADALEAAALEAAAMEAERAERALADAEAAKDPQTVSQIRPNPVSD